MTLIETAGQAMKRTKRIYRVVPRGNFMVLSLLSLASLVEQKRVIPATTTGRLTNSPPICLSAEVSQAVNMPPSSELLKKAR
jgi:hypothetical protein